MQACVTCWYTFTNAAHSTLQGRAVFVHERQRRCCKFSNNKTQPPLPPFCLSRNCVSPVDDCQQRPEASKLRGTATISSLWQILSDSAVLEGKALQFGLQAFPQLCYPRGASRCFLYSPGVVEHSVSRLIEFWIGYRLSSWLRYQ